MAALTLIYDKEADAAYISFVTPREKYRSTRQCNCLDQNDVGVDGIVLDVDDFGMLLGMEILKASQHIDPTVLAQAEAK